MKLSSIEGIGETTRKKLEKAGIKSVKDLATLDTRNVHVDGIGRERLQQFKKAAQKTLYQAASSRVVTAARMTGEAIATTAVAVERQARAAFKELLEAAWEAEHRAIEALRASQARAQGVAEAAAERARAAQKVAEEKTRLVLAQIQGMPEKAREAWSQREETARQAEASAREAARRASEAAQAAGVRVKKGAEAVTVRSRSLFSRLKSRSSGRDQA